MGARLLKGLSLVLGALTSCDAPRRDTSDFGCPEYGCTSICTLHGTVVDAATREPIEGIEVSRPSWGYETTTDASGAFSLGIDCCEVSVPLITRDLDGSEQGGPYAPQRTEVLTQVAEEKPCYQIREQREDIGFELKPVITTPIESPR